MEYEFECIIKNKKNVPIACELYIKGDYPDTLEDKQESCFGEDSQSGESVDVNDWFVGRVDYHKNYIKKYLI